MPRYYFHVFGLEDDTWLVDDEGTEFPTSDEAFEEARGMALDFAADADVDPLRARIQVTDEQGTLLADRLVSELVTDRDPI